MSTHWNELDVQPGVYTDLSRTHPKVLAAIPSRQCAHCGFVGDERWVFTCSECGALHCRDWCTNLHWKAHRPETSQAIIDQDLHQREHRRWSKTLLEERQCYNTELGQAVGVKCELSSLDGFPQYLRFTVTTTDPKVARESHLQDVPHCHKCRPQKRVVFKFNRTDWAYATSGKVGLKDWRRFLFGQLTDQFEWFLEDVTGLPEWERAIEASYFQELVERWRSGSGEDTLVRIRRLRFGVRAWLRRSFYVSVLAQGTIGALAASVEAVSVWWIFGAIPIEILTLWLLEARRLNTDHEHFGDYEKNLASRHRWRGR